METSFKEEWLCKGKFVLGTGFKDVWLAIRDAVPTTQRLCGDDAMKDVAESVDSHIY